MSVVSACLSVIFFAVLIIPSGAAASDLGQLFFPLPFAGPYGGTVTYSEAGHPIPGAIVEVSWMRHDNPLPDGVGHNAIKASVQTDRNGVFKIERQETRGGLFQTDVSIKVTAKGYIKRVLILDPRGTPLPQQTIDWSFQDTSVHRSPPEPLKVKLKPALPVLLKALQSKDPLIQQIAEQELRKLKPHPTVSPQ
jgi:hypothetical protein